MGNTLRSAVTATVAGLPRPYRQLLALSEVDGLSASQIGTELGIAPAQVRVGLLHARRALCQRLSARMHATGR